MECFQGEGRTCLFDQRAVAPFQAPTSEVGGHAVGTGLNLERRTWEGALPNSSSGAGGPRSVFNNEDLAVDFASKPNLDSQHDVVNPEASKEIGGLDIGDGDATSITRFLTLSIVIRRSYSKFRDSIFYFAKSKFLT
jgi:hypothetical protein